MNCPVCGNVLIENTKECAVCGNDVRKISQKDGVKLSSFLSVSNQLLLIGVIALTILTYTLINNISDYVNLIDLGQFGDNSLRVAGIFGLVVGIPMLISTFILLVFQTLFVVKNNLSKFNNFRQNLITIGFIMIIFISLFSLVMMIWVAAIIRSFNYFSTTFISTYGLLAIFVWLFYIVEKPTNIFSVKSQTPVDEVRPN